MSLPGTKEFNKELDEYSQAVFLKRGYHLTKKERKLYARKSSPTPHVSNLKGYNRRGGDDPSCTIYLNRKGSCKEAVSVHHERMDRALPKSDSLIKAGHVGDKGKSLTDKKWYDHLERTGQVSDLGITCK